MGDWPKRIVVALHSNKESMYELGESIGLDEYAVRNFRYCCYEVLLSVEVQEDGETKVLGLAE